MEDHEKYVKAKQLSDVTDDPEDDPFKSKYQARKLLQELRDKIHNNREENDDDIKLIAKEAVIEYHLAINYIYTEEIPAGQEHMNKVFELCKDDISLLPHVVSTVIAAHNEMSLVWSNREEGIKKAHEHLLKAEELFHKYKNQADEAPYTVHDHFLSTPVSEWDRNNFFENLHTYTLFYLAQVYKSLDKGDLSASYCMKTLRRQLEFRSYKPMEWALNCACLSQFFITRNMFVEAKHCLSCSNFIMSEVTQENEEIENKMEETEADIARCWVKYCLCLLEISKDRFNSVEVPPDVLPPLSGDVEKSYERFSLEVTSIEENVAHDYCTNYEEAKKIFLLGKEYATQALKHFVLDGFVTDFVEINQDISRLYQYVAVFESDVDLRCRMYKRRIDLLSSVLNELNPQFYLLVCRQLQFELGETYSEMMDMKIARYNSNVLQQTAHARKKINMLCNSSIKSFHEFLKTLRSSHGKYPEKFEEDVERPGLIAHFYIARLYSKLMVSDVSEKLQNLKMCLSYYSFVTNYVVLNEEAASCIEKELEICKDMVDVLPKTMDQLITSISSEA